ncbi:MAG: hypothetical protein SGI77_25375 [Pirellulaceae bacterium]|nr:hypothetical protein [Pirellulaceae bacterium]
MKTIWAALLLLAIQETAYPQQAIRTNLCDSSACDSAPADSCDGLGCDSGYIFNKNRKASSGYCDFRYRTPAMIGDFFGGSPIGFRADATLDRLIVLANDLDAPNVLPSAGSQLSISEAGPVGIYSSSLASTQQLQTLLRANSAIPSASLVGSINSSATVTTAQTISQIQSLLASTGLAYDIIAVQQPQGAYTSGVNSAFAARNGIRGTTTYDSNGSGALLQGGVDTLTGGEDLDAYYFYDYIVRFNTNLADASSGGVGRMKIAEGGTILPQDRVFFRYSYFDNVRYTNSGLGLSRFTPGFEKSFLDSLMSVELRAPFATDTVTDSVLAGSTFSNGSESRFGNLTVYLKALLHQTETLACVGGLGIVMPTANDIRVRYADGTDLLRINNQSLHLQPFLGFLYSPSSNFFAQGFVQHDTTASGNTVLLNTTGTGLTSAGRLTDQNQLFIDAGIGYWLYRSNACRGLTGIIPTLEVHQTSSTQDGDVVNAGPFQVGNFAGSTSVTSLVAGSTFEFGKKSQLTAGYATQLGGGSDRQYNGGLQVFYNRLLGW